MRRLIYKDTNLLARFKELRGSLKGCQIAKSWPELLSIERYIGTPDTIWANRCMAITMCMEHCPDSVNHIPIYKNIAHVTGTWLEVYAEYEIPYVCQVSRCKLRHIKQKPEELEAINTELPAPKDTTYKCHHCEAGFKNNTSLSNHMKTIHNAENSTAVKSVSTPVIKETDN